MKKYVLHRFLQLIPILLGITFLSFAMMRLAGSDVVTEMYQNRGTEVSQEIIDAKRAELGLDQPFLIQYGRWLGGMLTGDMGESYMTGKPVFPTFLSKLPATLLLTALSIILTILVSIPFGIFMPKHLAVQWLLNSYSKTYKFPGCLSDQLLFYIIKKFHCQIRQRCLFSFYISEHNLTGFIGKTNART